MEQKDSERLVEALAREQEEKLEGKALSTGNKFIYGLGNLPAALSIALVDTWIIYFYSPPESKDIYLSVGVAGVLNFLRYVCNAIGDPIVGFFSDRAKTGLGRRRPFILFGAPFLALFLALVWFPPTREPSWINIIMLGIYLTGFGFLYPVVVNPYMSLLPEITPYLKERIQVSTLMAYGEVFGRVIAQVITGFVVSFFLAHKFNLIKINLDGYKIMGIISGLILVAIYLAMVFKLKETPHSEKKEIPFGMVRAVVEVFKNSSFLPYIAIIAVFILSSNMLIIITPFFGKVVMGVKEEVSGLLLGVILIVAGLFFPLTAWLGGRVGKKLTFSIAMLWFGLVIPLFPMVKLVPGINPKIFGFVMYFIVAPPVSAVLVLQRPLISDVIDFDEKLTGYRRESMYMGAEGLITKLAWGISFLVAPAMMQVLGNSKDHPWGILVNGPLAGLFVLLATFYFWRKYPFKR